MEVTKNLSNNTIDFKQFAKCPGQEMPPNFGALPPTNLVPVKFELLNLSSVGNEIHLNQQKTSMTF